MRYPLNQTLAGLPPSGIRKFFEIVAQMPEVISLSVGEPDFHAPWHVRERTIYALETGDTHYTGNRGKPALLAATAQYLQSRFGIRYDPQTEIIATNGASEAFDLVARACLNAGDEVLLPTPSYVMYAPLIAMAGGTPVAVPVSAADGWRVTGKLLAQYVTPRTRLLVLNHPGNPTGVTLRKKELNSIAKLAIKHNLLVVSDEIYAELTYTGSHTALASLPGMLERTVTLAGFSKAWAMTGYRLGILAGPEPVVSAALKLHQYSALCASSLAQTAAIEALEHGDAELAKMRTEYALRRDYCVGECQRLGLPLVPPDGAFYLFPEVRSRTGLSGEEFALRLLHEKGVAVVPGNAFGAECADYIRLSFATSLDKLGTAWERIGELLKSLKK